MTSLILVAGHAIPRNFNSLDTDEGWYLKDFQTGEARFYVEHVRHGVKSAAADPDSLLLFAGGQTDVEAGPRTEGQGYWLVADHFAWFGEPAVKARASTEEFSMDSLENVLFGICRFKEMTGAYPESMVAVGWKFKGERFRMHCDAVRFPLERLRYEGVGDPPLLERNLHFEELRRKMFEADPFGRSAEAAAKKRARNFGRRQHGYLASCPEMREFLAG